MLDNKILETKQELLRHVTCSDRRMPMRQLYIGTDNMKAVRSCNPTFASGVV